MSLRNESVHYARIASDTYIQFISKQCPFDYPLLAAYQTHKNRILKSPFNTYYYNLCIWIYFTCLTYCCVSAKGIRQYTSHEHSIRVYFVGRCFVYAVLPYIFWLVFFFWFVCFFFRYRRLTSFLPNFLFRWFFFFFWEFVLISMLVFFGCLPMSYPQK